MIGTMPDRPDSLLWWRAGTVSAMSFLLGVVVHLSAGGLMPSWWALAAMFAVGTTICASVLARAATATRIIVLVVVLQTSCHALLTIIAGHAGTARAPSPAHAVAGPGSLPVGPGGRVGSLQDHYETMVAAPSNSTGLSIPDPVALLDHLPMFLAHTAVAVLVGLWLAAGERAAWVLLSLVVTAVVALLVAPSAVPVLGRRIAPVRRRPATLPCLARVARHVVRRGPPALLVA